MPPAAVRVVPRAEMTVLGGGASEEREEVQRSVLDSMMGVRVGPGVLGGRREIVVTGTEEERRVERMWEPTRPVEPIRSVGCWDILWW